MSQAVQTGTIETQVPSRLDRLPWSKFHWRVVIGLGAVWILDGLEVTMVASVAARLTEDGSGLNLSAGQIGLAGAIYIAGACLGALFFGQLTDRLGRKKMFMATLLVYLVATVATAFAFAPWYFYLARFFTGTGIGGEYAAINSAIDELIPARVRGQVDLVINGSYWLGAAIGAGTALFFLSDVFPTWLGWRLAFAVGAVLGLVILVVRRHVPESPRWLFIHGRQDEAERIVDGIEEEVREETGEELSEPEDTLTVRQRKAIPFRMIARTAFKLYPKRAVLGVALFVGQAFIYNGITFNLGTLLGTFFGVASGLIPIFIIVWALSNFLGPVLLGRFFDTIGRIPMIAGMYLGSALLTVPLAILMMNGALNRWTFMAFIVAIFFLASAGASAAYLTVSEVFPMETRALAIAFFYALGTAVGGITGPLLFGRLIGTENADYVAIAFFIGAGVMALGGVAEIFLGVRSEQANLEDIAQPLTASEADEEGAESASSTDDSGASASSDDESGRQADDGHSAEADRCRAEAEQVRAEAAEHRATALRLGVATGADDESAQARVQTEEMLAEMGELRARALEEQAAAHELRSGGPDERDESDSAAEHRAAAAEMRALDLTEQAQAISAEDEDEATGHLEAARAACERALADEQRALAEDARAAEDDEQIAQARADMHQAWARTHELRARAHTARAEGRGEDAEAAEAEGRAGQQEARAAEEGLAASEHRSAAQQLRGSDGRDQSDEDERARERAALEERVRERTSRRRARESTGLRRFRPGPSGSLASARTGGLDPARAASSERALDREIDAIVRVVTENGAIERRGLVRLVGARYWGPGRFGRALEAALDEGRIRKVSGRTYGPVDE